MGVACTTINHVADRLNTEQRGGLREQLRSWKDTDPRRVWPAVIKMSSGDTENLRKCAIELGQMKVEPTTTTSTVIASAFDTFLNAGTPEQLATLAPDLRPLLSDASRPDRERSAELDGAVVEHRPELRGSVSALLEGNATGTAFAAARGLVTALQHWGATDFDADTVAWIYAQLRSPHANVARVLANGLAEHASHVAPPEDAGKLVAGRLLRSVDDNDDPQTAGALLKLLIQLERHRQLDSERRSEVIERLKRSASELLPAAVPQKRRQHLPALFNLHKQALAALAIPHYNDTEVQGAIRDVLTTFDIADIASRSERTMAHLLITATSRTAGILALLEELWPTVSDSNKGAIAECVMHLDRGTAGERAKRLARRADCPIAIKNEIYRRFPL